MEGSYSFPLKVFRFLKRKQKVINVKSVENKMESENDSKLIPVFSNDYVSMFFHRESGILYQTWRGFCPGAEFRKAIDAVFEYMTENNIFKTVSDVRLQRVVPPVMQVYVEEKSLDFIRKNGLFYIAIVSEEKTVSHICAQAYSKRMEENSVPGISCFFSSLEEAEEWLSER